MISNSSSDGASHVYRYSSRWLEQPREVRIIVVGAGISGIAAVKLFREKFKNEPTTLTIYEKNDEVGGTWLENRYPGYVVLELPSIPKFHALTLSQTRKALTVISTDVPVTFLPMVTHTHGKGIQIGQGYM
jgi:ribulose 1,5-bisphosphate synthetase/thiazole synthase